MFTAPFSEGSRNLILYHQGPRGRVFLSRALYHEGVNTELDSCAAGSEGDPYSKALFQVVCVVAPAHPEHAFAASFEQP